MSLQGEQRQLDFVDGANDTDHGGLPTAQGDLQIAVNTIIACLAVLGNSLVITVMLLRRRVFSSFTNRLILHSPSSTPLGAWSSSSASYYSIETFLSEVEYMINSSAVWCIRTSCSGA